MATEDRSRSAFYPGKHYVGVRMQQGRVLTDDDYNEGAQIGEEEQRATRADVIGPHGSPDQGFLITRPARESEDDQQVINFNIGAGTYYVGGLRLTLEQPQTFREQRDWLLNPGIHAPPSRTERYDFIYLEAWQQPVSAVEDQELFEVALGGPDTTTRLRTMARVRVEPDVQTGMCREAGRRVVQQWIDEDRGRWDPKNNELVSEATLTVDYEPPDGDADLCSPQRTAGYLGAENQAIRVQLVEDGHAFTWGFDNGAPLYRVQVVTWDSDGVTRLRMLTAPKDLHHQPAAGQIVELLPWGAVLPNGEKLAEELEPGHLATVVSAYDPDTRELTANPPLPGGFGQEWRSRSDREGLGSSRFGAEEHEEYLFLRVWDRGADRDSPAAIPLQNDAGAPTEGPVPIGLTGLRISVSLNHRRAGDYWIIAVRPETPDEVVPWQLRANAGRCPDGIRRFYAPLALIHWGADNTAEITNCRATFRSLTELKTCCRYTVGDGGYSQGDYNSIETAIEQLPPWWGGDICLLPGLHRVSARIKRKFNVRIRGCGLETLVVPREQGSALFYIEDSSHVTLEHMTLVTLRGIAVDLVGTDTNALNHIDIGRNDIIAYQHAVRCRQGREVSIHRNRIRMLDVDMESPRGDVAIFLHGEDGRIERNDIAVIGVPDLPEAEEDSGGSPAFHECEDFDRLHSRQMVASVVQTVLMQALAVLATPRQFSVPGGIRIGSGSERVSVSENRIRGGAGHGITLGSDLAGEDFPVEFERLWKLLAPVYETTIERNEIYEMGLSGIGVPQRNLAEFLESGSDTGGATPTANYPLVTELARIFGALGGFALDLKIQRNRIHHCLRPDFNPDTLTAAGRRGEGGISLSWCERLEISDNSLEENGSPHYPACGIFISHVGQANIHSNRITQNGSPLFGTTAESIVSGIRGGIVLGYTSPFRLLNEEQGNYAARIHDNVICQPTGQALRVVGHGPMFIVDNRLITESPDATGGKRLAGAVYVKNLGRARYLQKSAGSANTGRLAGGNVLFRGNQTELRVATGCWSAQLLVTGDDLEFGGNQCDVVNEGEKDKLYFNTGIFGLTVRACDNRLQEPVEEQTAASLRDVASSFLAGRSYDPNSALKELEHKLDTPRISLLTFGIYANGTINNHGNHCIAAFNLIGEAETFGNRAIAVAEEDCKNLKEQTVNQLTWEQILGSFFIQSLMVPR